jgi:hypothetical protein
MILSRTLCNRPLACSVGQPINNLPLLLAAIYTNRGAGNLARSRLSGGSWSLYILVGIFEVKRHRYWWGRQFRLPTIAMSRLLKKTTRRLLTSSWAGLAYYGSLARVDRRHRGALWAPHQTRQLLEPKCTNSSSRLSAVLARRDGALQRDLKLAGASSDLGGAKRTRASAPQSWSKPCTGGSSFWRGGSLGVYASLLNRQGPAKSRPQRAPKPGLAAPLFVKNRRQCQRKWRWTARRKWTLSGDPL